MAKQLLFDDAAWRKVQSGVAQLARAVSARVDQMALKRGLGKCGVEVREAIDAQKRLVKDVNDFRQVDTISANHDEEIGGIIAQAVEKGGKDGVITVEEAKSLETKLD